MSPYSTNNRIERLPTGQRGGFTLLELLMVVAIMATIGGMVFLSVSGLSDDVESEASVREMRTLHDAIKAFRRDTGYYPKQGPFALTSDGGAVDVNNSAHWPWFLESATSTQRQDWFHHPANFYQLVLAQSPLNGTGHVLETFRPQTGRGWRGPYLKDGVAVVGHAGQYDPASHAHTPADWSPTDWNGVGGTSIVQSLVYVCDAEISQTGDFPVMLRAELLKDLEDPPVPYEYFAKYGRPYFYFLSGSAAWLVGMGPDRTYQGGTAASDDVVLYIAE